MKKNAPSFLLVATVVLFANLGFSQVVEVSGQFKPRYEMRHGFQTLTPDGAQAANFISQRTRLNLKYSGDHFRVGFSVQNVGVWGETATMRMADVNGTSVYQAWGELMLGKKVSLKAGRQELVYDDHRIFGNVDWAQQGRSHDGVVLSFKPKAACKIDIGIAYNALQQTYFREYYGISNYKALQFAHWHRDFGGLGASILVLNNGVAWRDSSDTTDSGNAKEKIAYSQTLGFRLHYKKEKISASGALYYQTGKENVDKTGDGIPDGTRKMDGLYVALDAAYAITHVFSAGAGFEFLSGNSMKDPADEDQAFKPFYGTNHKFNGLMDYFYVGSHMNSVGLLDIFIPVSYKKGKFSASLVPHFFRSAGEMYGMDKDGTLKDFSENLGTEIDLVAGYAIAPNAVISAGYSQLFATASMELLKGGNKDNTQNWAWVMIDLKPTFFKSEK